jgi:hypothetical protein
MVVTYRRVLQSREIECTYAHDSLCTFNSLTTVVNCNIELRWKVEMRIFLAVVHFFIIVIM